ncbi:MAG: hypothetical protein M3Y89_00130 [Actinomycetota bacterium]|nr:hypothetical protein [Actinomycetota bacterium]
MNTRYSFFTSAASVAGTAVALVRFWPSPARLITELTAPHAWLDRVGPDAATAALAGALLWLVALWLAVGFLATFLSLAPGRLGRAGRLVAQRAVPAALRNLLLASVGASLLLSPVAAIASPGPAVPAGTLAPNWPLDPPASSLPALPWPTDSGPQQPTGSPTTGAPAPTASPSPPTATGSGLSSTSPPASNAPPATPGQSAPPDGARPPTGPRQPRDTPPPATAPDRQVTVTAGDSLWTIAASRLGPAASDSEIAIEWPYWYRENRSVIGPNPGLLRPGTTLLAPDNAGQPAPPAGS